MIIVACILLFVALKALDVYTRHGQAVVVPSAKGMTVSQAKKLFLDKGLQCIVSDSLYVKEKPAGSILDHSPASGQKVKEGRTIYLTINTRNIPMQAVPDIADNSSLRQAQARIFSAGFKLTESQLINGEKDWVYAVKYRGKELKSGEKVPVGATLTLVVGNGAGGSHEENDSTGVAPVEGATDDSWF